MQSANYSQKLLVYDGSGGTFHLVKLRGRQAKCPVCGDNPTINKLIDYEQFCGAKASDKVSLEPHHEKTCIWGFQPGPTQTGLHSHRGWLEA